MKRRDYRLNEVDDVFCADGAPYCWTDADGVTVLSDTPRQQTITDLVHEVIVQREKIGMATYHRPLTAFDGRDTLQDAIEEAADLLQYLVKLKVERDSG